MLIACDSCHRQLDVGTHAAGAKVRCFCGGMLTVPARKPRDARMLHCASCGAGLPEGVTECGFCHSAVALGAKGLGEVCPECMARLVADARFCSSCGVPIRPVGVLKALTDQSCPRCDAQLSECTADDTQFVECTSCGGLWLGEETFRQLTERRERSAAPAILAARALLPALARDPTEDLRSVKYLKCPVCGERMNRRNFAHSSGVILDWCRGHGFWFDADELERILAFVDRGGLERQREREREALESERRRLEATRRERSIVPVAGPADRAPSFDVLDAIARLIGRWFT